MRRWGLWIGCSVLAIACGDAPATTGTDGEDGTTSMSSSGGSPDDTVSNDGPLPDGSGSDGGSTDTGSTDAGSTDTGSSSDGADTTTTTTGSPPETFEECFEGQFVNDPPFPDYDQYDPVIGSHCVGTNHQDIADVERVVFLGDSITVGSRPTLPDQAYRAVLANALRDQFGLTYGDGISEALWKAPDPFSGQSVVQHAGDFSSCARWGARNDDLPVMVGYQLEDCFADEQLDLTTLVVMTSGGNDVSSLAQDAIAGVPIGDLMLEADQILDYKRDAVEWLTAPGRFTNGIYVVFANIYEFTDGTADVMSCDVSGLAGFEEPVPNPEELTDLILSMNERYMEIATDTGTDMLFLLETFCGHGFGNENPESPCYRGPGSPRWFDLTCIHPNPQGHGVIADNFLSIINE